MSTTGEPGRPAVRVGASIVDMGTGMWAVIGILAALSQRRASGRGRIVDVSLFETAASWVSLIASQYLASGQLPARQGSGASGIVPYKAYATRDGELVVAAGSDGLFRTLATALGRPEWATDPRFRDNPRRVANQVCCTRCSTRSSPTRTPHTGRPSLKLPASPARRFRTWRRCWAMHRPRRSGWCSRYRGPACDSSDCRSASTERVRHRAAPPRRWASIPPISFVPGDHRIGSHTHLEPEHVRMNLPEYETLRTGLAEPHVLLVTLTARRWPMRSTPRWVATCSTCGHA